MRRMPSEAFSFTGPERRVDVPSKARNISRPADEGHTHTDQGHKERRFDIPYESLCVALFPSVVSFVSVVFKSFPSCTLCLDLFFLVFVVFKSFPSKRRSK